MAIISSHVLDAVNGTHAAGIRVECYRLNGISHREQIFDVVAGEEGRIVETIAADQIRSDAHYELVFHSAAYFAGQAGAKRKRQIMDVVVVRLTLPDADDRYHIPLVLSPHSYTIWWSE